MSYRSAARFFWSVYKFCTLVLVLSILLFIACALTSNFIAAGIALLASFAASIGRSLSSSLFASSFDHALTSRLTRDIWPSSSITPRERDAIARVKRRISGG